MLTAVLLREGKRYVFLEPTVPPLDHIPSLVTFLGFPYTRSVLQGSIFTLEQAILTLK